MKRTIKFIRDMIESDSDSLEILFLGLLSRETFEERYRELTDAEWEKLCGAHAKIDASYYEYLFTYADELLG